LIGISIVFVECRDLSNVDRIVSGTDIEPNPGHDLEPREFSASVFA
jgi:hypothetical protein